MTNIRTLLLVGSKILHADLAALAWRRVLLTRKFRADQTLSGQYCDDTLDKVEYYILMLSSWSSSISCIVKTVLYKTHSGVYDACNACRRRDS